MRKKTVYMLEVTHEDTDYNIVRQIERVVKDIPKVISAKIQFTLPSSE